MIKKQFTIISLTFDGDYPSKKTGSPRRVAGEGGERNREERSREEGGDNFFSVGHLVV